MSEALSTQTLDLADLAAEDFDSEDVALPNELDLVAVADGQAELPASKLENPSPEAEDGSRVDPETCQNFGSAACAGCIFAQFCQDRQAAASTTADEQPSTLELLLKEDEDELGKIVWPRIEPMPAVSEVQETVAPSKRPKSVEPDYAKAPDAPPTEPRSTTRKPETQEPVMSKTPELEESTLVASETPDVDSSAEAVALPKPEAPKKPMIKPQPIAAKNLAADTIPVIIPTPQPHQATPAPKINADNNAALQTSDLTEPKTEARKNTNAIVAKKMVEQTTDKVFTENPILSTDEQPPLIISKPRPPKNTAKKPAAKKEAPVVTTTDRPPRQSKIKEFTSPSTNSPAILNEGEKIYLNKIREPVFEKPKQSPQLEVSEDESLKESSDLPTEEISYVEPSTDSPKLTQKAPEPLVSFEHDDISDEQTGPAEFDDETRKLQPTAPEISKVLPVVSETLPARPISPIDSTSTGNLSDNPNQETAVLKPTPGMIKQEPPIAATTSPIIPQSEIISDQQSTIIDVNYTTHEDNDEANPASEAAIDADNQPETEQPNQGYGAVTILAQLVGMVAVMTYRITGTRQGNRGPVAA